ncbi:MAG: class I SAM-dependent methyltransferase [Dehalococcoidales bacterium]|nr:class I SAM-dependent methyltransferase [Dehalococcoidales bacterium]
MATNRDVFNRIAPGWYNFRHWSIFGRELEELARRWQGGRLLNLGCAHGADFLPLGEGFKLYGVDSSSEMLKFARRYARKFNLTPNLLLADVSLLPFDDRSFDWVISVATYHHLRRKQQRAALDELWRVLKPGGEVFITVWNRWQRRFWFKPKEVAIPWRTGDETLWRYYYLFSYPELENLVRSAGFRVLRAFPESSYCYRFRFWSRNICLLVGKP